MPRNEYEHTYLASECRELATATGLVELIDDYQSKGVTFCLIPDFALAIPDSYRCGVA
jgi:hypothetical protein